MKTIKVTICRSKDHYGAFATNYSGIYGAGDSVEDAKNNILEAIEIIKETGNNVPDVLKGEYNIEYSYDVNSFLQYYAGILTLRGLSKITGIHEGQLSHYMTGHRKPSKRTIDVIEKGLHNFAKELDQVRFV